ncbi:unnamed protein product [Clonostachys solani]|uniref:DUF7770 domain-containing protein n=1 Tax=Clonostachys solani TaxID=160281 RepID=A0A9N9ZJ01_9HYPO|nr:unnamed protein product [Clonostachys solani]
MSTEISEQEFNITRDPALFPTELLAAKCAAIYLEIVDVNRYHTSETGAFPQNHASLKIDFEDPILGIRGLCLDAKLSELEPSHDKEHNPMGAVCIKPVRWTHQSPGSLRTLKIRSKYGFLFREIFDLIVKKKMTYFSFVSIDRQFFGCRDFIAQLLSVLEDEGLVESAVDKAEVKDMPGIVSVYEVLGRRFGRGRVEWCPIYKGEFLIYKRINLENIEYSPAENLEL